MCLKLKSKWTLPRISFKDKVVYKNLIKDEGVLRTPYHYAKIEINNTYKSNIYKEHDFIEAGLHSFANLNSCSNPLFYKKGSTITVKCIIPKFTFYYKGSFFGSKSYASKKLKYIEILNL